VNRLVDTPEFGARLGQLRWAVINTKPSHDLNCLHHLQLQRIGQAKRVVPVVLDEICVNTMPRHGKLNPEQAKLAQRFVEEGKSICDIAETFNLHAATIYGLSAAGA
jgi:hypothetical protein